MSKEKPILFSTPMVQAILDGRKTMTRRVVKKKYDNTDLVMRTDKYGTRLVERQNDAPEDEEIVMPDGSKATRCHLIAIRDVEPRYKPGDILWVRETWKVQAAHRFEADARIEFAAGGPMSKIQFSNSESDSADRTDYDAFIKKWFKDSKWHPSIYMPRAAARIFLRVTDVRVERLQDIKPHDAHNEGIAFRPFNSKYPHFEEWLIKDFRDLWDSLNAKRGYEWDTNPWVWVIKFERCEKPQVGL